MPVFSPKWNTIATLSVFAVALAIVIFFVVLYTIYRASYITDAGLIKPQPLPFSHAHHAAGAGLDCRYCHTMVESAAFAGMPTTKTCMTCHSQLWWDSPALAPVRNSFEANRPLFWSRIQRVPDFVYFDHSIHIAKGVGCSTCHGRIDHMPMTYRYRALYMSECLDCHRQPEKYLRPKERIFDMAWVPPANQLEIGQQLSKNYHLRPAWSLTNCSTCHR